MSHIVLTEEQARLVNDAYPVEVRDMDGKVVGHLEPLGFTPEEISEAKRQAASAGPWYTGPEVQQRLAALEDAERRLGRLDKTRLYEVLSEIRAQDDL